MIYTIDTWPTARWPNFSFNEACCSYTSLCDVDDDFMDLLQELRLTYGKPMHVTSLYRHPTHPVEAKKDKPGTHTTGKAVDIAVGRGQAMQLIRIALPHVTGLGVKQHGKQRFLHFDVLQDELEHVTRPMIWSYR